jgi:fluoride ion exporter CrcB/FEX
MKKKILFCNKLQSLPISYIHYNFDNPLTYNGTGNTIFDLYGNNNSTLFISPVFNNTAPKNFSFNGTNQYAQSVNKLISGQSISVSIWFKPTRNNQFETVINSINYNATDNIGFAIQNRQNNNYWISVQAWGIDGTFINFSTTLNQWVNITFTYNNVVLKCYKNAVLVGSVAAHNTYKFLKPNNILIAKGAINAGEFFKGDIGDLQVWNTDITQNEILVNFNNKRNKYGL